MKAAKKRRSVINFAAASSEFLYSFEANKSAYKLYNILYTVSTQHQYSNIIYATVIKKGIQLNNRKLVNTILYADDQILMATSEDDLQTMAHHLNLIARKYKNDHI